MTAINRFSQLHSERKALAPLSDREWCFDLMHSFKAGQERENFVLDIAADAGEQPAAVYRIWTCFSVPLTLDERWAVFFFKEEGQ